MLHLFEWSIIEDECVLLISFRQRLTSNVFCFYYVLITIHTYSQDASSHYNVHVVGGRLLQYNGIVRLLYYPCVLRMYLIPG